MVIEKAVQKLLENIAWPNEKSKKEIQVSYLFSIHWVCKIMLYKHN